MKGIEMASRRSRIRLLALALCLALSLTGCAGDTRDGADRDGEALEVAEGFHLYSGEDLGFSFLYPAERSVGYTQDDGAYIYCGAEGELPYVLVCRAEGSTSPKKYFDAFTDLMLDSFDSVASSEIHSVAVGDKTLYMVRYLCGGDPQLVVDRYLEPYDSFYIQYTSMSYETCSLDTELYYAIYTLLPEDDAYAGAYSQALTNHQNPDTGITVDIPDMLETWDLYVGFYATGENARFLTVYCDEDDEGKPIYNRQDFIDRAAVSSTFVADQLGADTVSFSEGSSASFGSRTFYCYPMRMTTGGSEFGGMLCIANADDTGCYLVCYGVRDGCPEHDGLQALLEGCAESFTIS